MKVIIDGVDQSRRHNSSTGKQGGTTGQYYHLNLAYYNEIINNFYAYLPGRSGGQTLNGGNTLGDPLYLQDNPIDQHKLKINYISTLNTFLSLSNTIANNAGTFNLLTVAPSSNPISTSTAIIRSIEAIPEIANGNIRDHYMLTGGRFNPIHKGTGLLAEARGIYSTISRTSTGNITTGYGLYIDTIDAITGWGVYQSNVINNNYFAGKLGIGSGPTWKFHVEESNTATSGTMIGSYTLVTADPPSASSQSSFGKYVQVRNDPSNNNNITGTHAMYRGTVDWYGTGTLTSMYGFWPSVVNRETGTVTSAVGLYGLISNVSTGTIDGARGVLVDILKGGGTITTAYGILINNVQATTNGYGIYISTVTGSANAWGVYQSNLANKNYFAGTIAIGTITPATSAILDLTSTTKALIVTRMTTTQRDALTAVNGMVIFNTTTLKFQGYAGGWVDFH